MKKLPQTLFSSKAKPLVNRYKFIKGFKDGKDGYLDSILRKDGVSNSKLVIDNLKLKKFQHQLSCQLLHLQGIADLLTGEGIRFTDFGMNFTNQDKPENSGVIQLDQQYLFYWKDTLKRIN